MSCLNLLFSLSAPFAPPGSETVVKFDPQGDGMGRYNIFSYQRNADRYGYVPVGEWAESLSLSGDLIRWPREALPTSQCSDPCERNEMKKMQAGGRRASSLCRWFGRRKTFRIICHTQCLQPPPSPPRRVLLLDLHSLRASRIPG